MTPNSGDVHVRIGVEADVDACAELACANAIGSKTDWTRTLTMTVADGGRGRELFVAESAGSIVGYARAVNVRTPLDADDAMPVGWFLLGIVVDIGFRRRGVGTMLTATRIEWLRDRTDRVYYFTGPANVASQRMHLDLGFVRQRPCMRIASEGQAGSTSEQVLYSLDLCRRDGHRLAP